MKLIADAYQWMRVRRTIGVLLVIAAPGLSLGKWYSTRQPLEVMALAERMRASLPKDHYESAMYHGSHAQDDIDHMWSPTGFASLGVLGFAIGLGLLLYRPRRAVIVPSTATGQTSASR